MVPVKTPFVMLVGVEPSADVQRAGGLSDGPCVLLTQLLP